MAKDQRFEKVYSQGSLTVTTEIWVDKQTGVNYLFHTSGYSGGACRDAGGRTYLSVVCECGDFHFGSIRDDSGRVVGVEIACCGDDGLNAVMKALEFAQTAINDQRCEVDD